MADLLIRDGSGANKYLKQHSGTGSLADPYVSQTHAIMQSYEGTHAFIGQFGELLVADVHDEISVQFQYNISVFEVETAVTGDGAVAQEGSYAKLSSTTGTSKVYSIDNLRYRPGHTALTRFTASFNGGGIGTVGLYDDNDGIYITYNNGALSVSYRNGGSATTVASASFNGEDISGIDFTKINVFQISFGWLGVAPIRIEVMGPDGNFQIIHQFNTQGQLTTTHIGNPVLPVRMETSGAMTIKTGSWQGANLGNGSSVGSKRPFSWSGNVTLSGTNLATIINFQNIATFNSKINKVKARLLRFQFYVDTPATGEGTVEFKIIGNPTLTGTPSWTNVYTNESVMQYDTVADYLSGGQTAIVEYIGYAGANKGGSGGGIAFDSERLGLIANPSDSFSITAQNVAGTTNVTVRATFNWEELF